MFWLPPVLLLLRVRAAAPVPEPDAGESVPTNTRTWRRAVLWRAVQQAVIDSHKKLMYYAAVLSADSFSSLWNDVKAAEAAAAPQEGEDEKGIWDAPAAVGENDDEDGYE